MVGRVQGMSVRSNVSTSKANTEFEELLSKLGVFIHFLSIRNYSQGKSTSSEGNHRRIKFPNFHEKKSYISG